MIRKLNFFLLIVYTPLLIVYSPMHLQAQATKGKVHINFTFTANQKPLCLKDSLYENEWGEIYSVSKIKYYVSSFMFDQQKLSLTKEKYRLISTDKKINMVEFDQVPSGSYSKIRFTIGIDSIDNCQGAQKGVLDPINDMFWTWNSGYVFFKLEGMSNRSNSDLNRIEYHIGGYKKRNATIRNIELITTTPIEIIAGKTTDKIIELNLDNLWDNTSRLSIQKLAVCVSPGEDACRIADQFIRLFSIKNSVH